MNAPIPALVVDDEPAIANLVGAFLGRLGLAATLTNSFCEAEALLIDGTPWRLLVTDLQLGGPAGADGMRLLELCRARLPDCSSILISGSAGPEIDEQARARGAARFLSKPLGFAELAEAVRSLGSLGVGV
jgi:CheY-like chemotaxis protein